MIQRQKKLRLETLEQRRVFDSHLSAGFGEVVAEFALLDVNPTSETYNQNVSPADFRGEVSAWYFGHAT